MFLNTISFPLSPSLHDFERLPTWVRTQTDMRDERMARRVMMAVISAVMGSHEQTVLWLQILSRIPTGGYVDAITTRIRFSQHCYTLPYIYGIDHHVVILMRLSWQHRETTATRRLEPSGNDKKKRAHANTCNENE